MISNHKPTEADIEQMLLWYLCALWETAPDDDDRVPIDKYSAKNVDHETLESMRQDCAMFAKWAWPYLYGDSPKLSWAEVGYDFLLTRNGHGAGFWSKPEIYGEAAVDILTKIAQKFPEVDLVVVGGIIYEEYG